jgi:predicted DNA-binding protein
MTVSVRLDPDLEQQLTRVSEQTGVSKSQIIKQSLIAYLHTAKPKTPYELGEDLFDGEGSGEGDLSSTAKIKARMTEIIRAKTHR